MFVCNFGTGQPWIPGHIVRLSGPVSFEVQLANGQVVRRHQDHLRIQSESTESSNCERLSEELVSMPVPYEVGPEKDSVPVAPAAAMTLVTTPDPKHESATSSPPCHLFQCVSCS